MGCENRRNLKTIKLLNSVYIPQSIIVIHVEWKMPFILNKDHCNTFQNPLEMLFLFFTAEGAVLANNLFQSHILLTVHDIFYLNAQHVPWLFYIYVFICIYLIQRITDLTLLPFTMLVYRLHKCYRSSIQFNIGNIKVSTFILLNIQDLFSQQGTNQALR